MAELSVMGIGMCWAQHNIIGSVSSGEFAAGAAQFRADVAVNPNDTEEAIWAFLCEAQISSAADARTHFLEVCAMPHSTALPPCDAQN